MIKPLLTLLSVLLLISCAAAPSLDRGVSIGTTIDDSALELSLRAALIQRDARFADADIVVLVHNGRVLLVGRVPTATMVQAANEVVQRQEGVRLLHNRLLEGPNRTSEMTLNDQWMSVRGRTQLSLTREVPAQRVVLVTFQGTSYLMGRLTAAQADIAEQRIAGVSGVQRVVSMFDFIDSSL